MEGIKKIIIHVWRNNHYCVAHVVWGNAAVEKSSYFCYAFGRPRVQSSRTDRRTRHFCLNPSMQIPVSMALNLRLGRNETDAPDLFSATNQLHAHTAYTTV